MRQPVIILLPLMLLVACGDSETTAGPPDFTTPQAAVRTLIAAAAAKDVALLRQCFAADPEGDFEVLAQGTATPEQLQEFAAFLGGARPGNARSGPDWARVQVHLADGAQEEVKLTKEGDVWKVTGM